MSVVGDELELDANRLPEPFDQGGRFSGQAVDEPFGVVRPALTEQVRGHPLGRILDPRFGLISGSGPRNRAGGQCGVAARAVGLLQNGDAGTGLVGGERGREPCAAGADDQDIDRGVEVARGVRRWHITPPSEGAAAIGGPFTGNSYRSDWGIDQLPSVESLTRRPPGNLLTV